MIGFDNLEFDTNDKIKYCALFNPKYMNIGNEIKTPKNIFLKYKVEFSNGVIVDFDRDSLNHYQYNRE